MKFTVLSFWLATSLGLCAAEVPWMFAYDARELPENSSPPWRVDEVDGPPDASIVTVDSSNVLRQLLEPGRRAGWRISSGKVFDLEDTCTVEMRARILRGTGFVVGLEVRNFWVGGVRLRVSTSAVELLTTTDRKRVDFPIESDFHTFRLVVEGPLAKLFLNGDSSPLLEIEGTAGDGRWLQFGEAGHVRGSGEVEYDYVQWTTGGAFPP